jgi:ATP-dependent Lhr-like helicase
VHRGYIVPTDKRILIENWGEFIIIHCHFGTLINRTLAQLLGHFLTGQTGHSIVVQHDPYRIFLNTMGDANSESAIKLFERIKQMNRTSLRNILIDSTRKTGIFKRRMLHVARRFGGLQKWVDLSKVSLSKLLKSYENSSIYDEALKETFTKDLELNKTLEILAGLREGSMEIQKIATKKNPSPIAQVGIEKVNMKTDLIPPDRMKNILLESAKARLLNETRTFICTKCWEYMDFIRIHDLPQKPTCPLCGSLSLGVTEIGEKRIQPLIDKKGEKLTKSEIRLYRHALATAELINKHGKVAAVALCGRNLSISIVKEILLKENILSNNLFELITEAERQSLRRKFW